MLMCSVISWLLFLCREFYLINSILSFADDYLIFKGSLLFKGLSIISLVIPNALYGEVVVEEMFSLGGMSGVKES